MLFKDIKMLIFTPCKVCIGEYTSGFLNIRQIKDYDEKEVIGIRSSRWSDISNEAYILVSLRG